MAPAPWQPVGAPTANPNVDMVARATPGGGIRFIGGAPVPGSPGTATSFNRAASRIRPSVVALSAVQPTKSPAEPPAGSGARFIDPFDGVPDRVVGDRAFEAVGSGVIVDEAGYVVTNYHVIAGAAGILVSPASDTETHLPATVVLADPSLDLALLKIEGDQGVFPAATLADSSRVRVGDWVLAVGYPFGLELTVTSGIVGGRHVSLVIGGVPLRGLLQTDAPINKGSSGGPLVDLEGQVVGINTAIYAPTGVFSGTGFAIPSNRVGAFVARGLESVGHFGGAPATPPPVAGNPFEPTAPLPPAPAANASRVWLGVGLVDVTPEMAAQLSYPFAGGAFVASVILDSPAEEAEILRGDIIVSVAGQPVGDVETVGRVVEGLAPGQSVPVTIWRGGKTSTVTMRLRGGG